MSLADGDEYLSGAVIEGWRAKSLRGEARGLGAWDEAAIVQFLQTGRTAHTAAFGAMADVVENSTSFFTDEDAAAVAAYLKQLPPAPEQETRLPIKPDTTTAQLRDGTHDSRGAAVYMQQCAACHGVDGGGDKTRVAPPLDKNSAIYADTAHSIIQVVLEGERMPYIDGTQPTSAMPGFEHLSDEAIAAVVNFVRTGWTNQTSRVSVEDVKAVRAFLENSDHDVPRPD